MTKIALLLAAGLNPMLCSMATDPATLGGGASLGGLAPQTDPAASLGGGTPAPAPAADGNAFTFRIPNTETDIGIDIAQIPADVRMDFLKKGLRDYITNAVNQENVRKNKANAPFDAYDEAVKADALQTAVAKPDGERAKPDLIGTAAAARERLYKGEVRKQGEGGEGRKRETVDPLTKLVTEAVVRELHQKDKDAGGKRKYTEFTAEVAKAGGGVKYLEAKIAEKVAAGTDEALLRKFMDERYIKPAQMMLGTKTNKATAAENSIL